MLSCCCSTVVPLQWHLLTIADSCIAESFAEVYFCQVYSTCSPTPSVSSVSCLDSLHMIPALHPPTPCKELYSPSTASSSSSSAALPIADKPLQHHCSEDKIADKSLQCKFSEDQIADKSLQRNLSEDTIADKSLLPQFSQDTIAAVKEMLARRSSNDSLMYLNSKEAAPVGKISCPKFVGGLAAAAATCDKSDTSNNGNNSSDSNNCHLPEKCSQLPYIYIG